jgi:Zn-dependent peptidase ImmA (M78 family)
MRPIDHARRLFQYIDLDLPPVSLEAILEALDISVQSARLGDDVFGYAVHVNERPLIIVESASSLVRQRWTIAHELGHCLLPGHIGQLARDGHTSKLEREANQFAAELLMPNHMVKTWWEHRRKLGREEAIKQMAWDFQVSRQAMEIRLKRIGLIEENYST